MADASIVARAPVCKTKHICLACGEDFLPKRTDRTKCCSRECGWAWSRAKSEVTKRAVHSVLRKRCRCGTWHSRRGSTCSDACRLPAYAPVLKGSCRQCGVSFVRTEDGASRYLCSEACRESASLAHKETARRSPSRRADKKLRRAIARGANGGEKIDPIKVFERDAYRCGICGSRTSKGKRGTYHPKAPELDHIVPVSAGGLHTYSNVQCACRSCNISKGASMWGQLHLFPAA